MRSGLVVATVAVAVPTGVVLVLRPHVPVLSTGVLYLLGVLLVSSVWGLWLALLTSVASALAFNFCDIPPTGGFTISDPANWLGLVVYLVAAVVVSAIADQARRRAEVAEQQIETESLRRSDALKTALLRTVSHDLRSPLTAIRAAAGAVDSTTLDDDQRRELADVIRIETDRLTSLVQDLLDLSRLESGTAEPRCEPCSVEELVDTVMASRELQSTAVQIQLPVDLPAVLVDAAQMERVLSNLLANAVHYGSNGRAVAVSADAADGRVRLRVSDHGSGIPAEDLTRIFEPFYRGKRSRGHGSGVGLAIVKGFVEGNGGHVSAQSRVGEGSTFIVDLPAAP